MKLSQLAENLIGSEIIKIGNEVNEMKAKGIEIANLTIGDLDSNLYPIPEKLRLGITDAYNKNLTNYPPASGLLNLRESVSEDLKQRWNLDYSVDDILISGGSRPLIYAAFRTIVDEGDKVIFPVPSWNNNHYTYLTSGQKIEIETSSENNFLPTAEEIKAHIKDAVLLTLCSPLNPTGTMFTEKQLREICQLVIDENNRREKDQKPLYILYDQIYAMLTFENTHFNPVSLFPELKPYTIYIDGISKCFAATGVRVGWSFGPSHIIDSMKSLLGHIGAWAPKPEQYAVADFLKNTKQVNLYVEEFKLKLMDSLNELHNGIQIMKNEGYAVDSIRPMGALYLTISLNYIGKKTLDNKNIETSSDLVFYLIREAGVALVPFSAFGNSAKTPWFRASIGVLNSKDISDLFPRLKKALDLLKD